jgi:hypothetical protein
MIFMFSLMIKHDPWSTANEVLLVVTFCEFTAAATHCSNILLICSDAARSVEGTATESEGSEGFTQSSGSGTATFSFGSSPSNGSNLMAGFSFGRYALSVSVDNYLVAKLFNISGLTTRQLKLMQV